MKRGANGDIFLKLIEKIRRTIPDVAIRTSFIVGFPGETDADFDELCRFVEAAQFDRVGVFRYSDDETSASFHLDGKVSAGASYNRMRRLMGLQRKISRKRNRALVGQSLPILICGPSAETPLLWEGRLQTQAEEIDGKTFLTDLGEHQPAPGDFGRVRITRSSDYDLFGELVSVERRRTEIRSAMPAPPVAAVSSLLTVLQ
jgi:ribosomal protein S12 methylthiotransferase